jgi:L-aspartate oxidase
MTDYVSIVRSDKRLTYAIRRLRLLYEETEELYKSAVLSPQLCELSETLISVAYLITKQAIFRKENKGLHYNTDLIKLAESISSNQICQKL